MSARTRDPGFEDPALLVEPQQQADLSLQALFHRLRGIENMLGKTQLLRRQTRPSAAGANGPRTGHGSIGLRLLERVLQQDIRLLASRAPTHLQSHAIVIRLGSSLLVATSALAFATRIKSTASRNRLHAGIVASLAAAMLAACAPAKIVGSENAAAQIALPVWPSPPDPPRFVFETVLRSSADIHKENPDEKMQALLTGKKQSEEPVFLKPGAVAARGGRVYVADTMGSAIVVFDAPRQRVFRFGQRSPGTVAVPSGLAVDKNGTLYVADSKNRTILIYDSLGLYRRSIGDKTLLRRPTGVAADLDRDRIYVVDRGDNDSDAHRLIAFRRDGSIAWQLGTRGSAPGEFNAPLQVAVAPDGTICVLDSGNFRVQAFSPEGKFLSSFGSVGVNLGMLWRPRGLAIDADGRIYVSDAGFSNVQIFDRNGALLLVIGQTSKEDRPGQYGLLSGIAVDETGRIYVVDQMFRKVEVIRPANGIKNAVTMPK